MDVMGAAWWSWMVSMAWQVGLLVAVLAVVDRLIRGWAWPQVRYALWLLVIVKLVMPPWWALPGGGLPAAIVTLGTTIERTWSADGSAPDMPPSVDVSIDETVEGGAASGDAGGMKIFWPTVAFVVWILGMLAVAVVIAVRTARLARWHREQTDRPTIPEWFHDLLVATSRRLGLERVPAVVFSEEAVTPWIPSLPTRPPHMITRSPGKVRLCSAGSPATTAGIMPTAVTNTRHLPKYPGSKRTWPTVVGIPDLLPPSRTPSITPSSNRRGCRWGFKSPS